MFETLKLVPAKIFTVDGEVIAILAFSLGGLAWVFVPFFDKATSGRRRSLAFTIAGLVIVIYMVAMTIYGFVT